MRFFYLLVFCLFSSSMLFAQIELAPITSNPILQAHQARNGKNIPIENFQAKVTSDCPDPDMVKTLFSEGETLYVNSGEVLLICMDEFLFDNLDTASCTNCSDLQFGTVVYNPDDFCFSYTSNPGLILETGDEMTIEVCDDYGCRDLVFPIVVKRANQSFTQTPSSFPTESSNTLCLNNIQLPGTEKNFSFAGCHNETYGQAILLDSCFKYNSFRFQEEDEVCIEVCNEFCICDTYTFPISITGTGLQLPFFDDFSNEGPYPDRNLWLDDNVYINTHLPYQPPSVGAATFDGLDEGGSPYGNGFGPADVLTSGYLDLGGLAAGDNVYLSYYIQPKGNSHFFPGPNDSLTLQFRNDTGVWERIETYSGLSNSTSPLADIPFVNRYTLIDSTKTNVIDTIIPPDTFFVHTLNYDTTNLIRFHHIDEGKFLHNRFQFRFINHCKRTGMQYMWHLDYVKITQPGGSSNFFKDIAFTNLPNSILKEYRHMPWDHFIQNGDNELRKAIDIEAYNNSNEPIKPNVSNLKITELTNNEPIGSSTTLLLTVPVQQNNFFPLIHASYTNSIDFSAVTSFTPTNEEDLVFELEYSITPDVGAEIAGYPAVTKNNTVRSLTHFSNYFAYDDGSPEGVISGNQENIQIASQFHSNIADSLVAIQVNFPYAASNLNADFILKVWLGDLEQSENPIYTSPPLSPILADQFFDTLNAFSTYKLVSETLEEVKIPLPAGTFFVGIQQVSGGSFGIGYDLNSPAVGSFQWYRSPGSLQEWINIIQPGALMIRPVVGGESPSTTATEDLAAPSLQVKLFPNPASDRIQLAVNQEHTTDLEMVIVNSTGQILLQQNWEWELDLNNWSNGLYFIQLRDRKTGAEVMEKFLILR